MHPGRRVLALGALAWLAGCASLPPDGATQIDGRLSVSVAAHGSQPARGLQAGFQLRGDASAGELRLSNPLGLQVAAARWRPGEAVLTSADGESRFDGLEALAREALGEPVPLQALPDWLQGRPWPGAASQPVPGGFEQLGWTVDLGRWADGLVTAVRRAEPAVTVRARVERPS
jgi:outer membrane lipoprotein LolB